jgi:hypothetical protein
VAPLVKTLVIPVGPRHRVASFARARTWVSDSVNEDRHIVAPRSATTAICQGRRNLIIP